VDFDEDEEIEVMHPGEPLGLTQTYEPETSGVAEPPTKSNEHGHSE
jgi:hypothetical protein